MKLSRSIRYGEWYYGNEIERSWVRGVPETVVERNGNTSVDGEYGVRMLSSSWNPVIGSAVAL